MRTLLRVGCVGVMLIAVTLEVGAMSVRECTGQGGTVLEQEQGWCTDSSGKKYSMCQTLVKLKNGGTREVLHCIDSLKIRPVGFKKHFLGSEK